MNKNEEEYVLLCRAIALVPASARPKHSSTVVRWAMRGVGNPKVKLETYKVGGRRYTSQEAMDRFLKRLSQINATQYKTSIQGSDDLIIERFLESEGI